MNMNEIPAAPTWKDWTFTLIIAPFEWEFKARREVGLALYIGPIYIRFGYL